jgi:hypothetical protein
MMKIPRNLAVLVVLVALVSASCGTPGKSKVSGNGPYRTIPENRPDWTNRPSSGTSGNSEIAFRGVSRRYAAEQAASNEAMADARHQVLVYYGEYIQENSAEKQTINGVSSETLVSWIEREQEIVNYANGFVSQVYSEE